MKENRRERLDDLYRHYARPLYYYLYKMSGSRETAEDLTQETFVRATVSLSFYQQEDVRAWLFKVARNAYLDEWRKRQRRKKIPFADYLFSKDEMTSPYGLPEDSALQKETKEKVEDLLGCLPEQYRSVLYLREYESFSYSEIEEALDLSENQVKVTLHRARKKLAQIADSQWREKDE
ncbi:sigma-70 family RNA polymerase sigma factor [Bacillus sp. ISL-47]|uniref:sigma-70 family RNA polymerase sigma factor n=1 Tax=Bacillus sp. ISL-47 TaxID=2819130 RepID=UPI001BEBEF6F|nr:sigma-70 family RNA polymerase sigma factor [Bacillus sp. ISL-47]MBT2688637.1 sigma-70 family RNA polymerase sigma factor [Bacillus sp. ISL-47]MBT2710623.1 sigma-70 family RNA polymerase sigma factor [Pseudomonas sp. ISL-84]